MIANMKISVHTALLRNLAEATLVLFSESAYPQDSVQRVTTACNASLRQMAFWCVKAGDADGAIANRIEQESKCERAKQLVDGHCYPVQVPLLGCNSALQEMEIWCIGNAKINVTAVVEYCEQSQRNIRLFCYR